MSNYSKSLFFAGILCVLLSLLLTLAATGLKPYQEKNVALDKKKNVLKAVGLISRDQKLPSEKIETLFKEKIKPYWVSTDGSIVPYAQKTAEDLPIYLYTEEKTIKSYIIPINTRGLWGQIQGYLALNNDGTTVSGFTVYKHNETPGLGGEIEQQWFQKNFVGKKIVDRQGSFVSISIAKGPAADKISPDKLPHYVDGISGATLTGKYLSAGFQDILSEYEPISVRFRRNIVKEIPQDASSAYGEQS
jgi:Na+-transporting NADH:ubiquinone oxidoreductase subunit C